MRPDALTRLTAASLLLGFAGLFLPWAVLKVDIDTSRALIPRQDREPPSLVPISVWDGLILTEYDDTDAPNRLPPDASSSIRGQIRTGLAISRLVLIIGPVVWVLMLTSVLPQVRRNSRIRLLALLGILILGGVVALSLTGPGLIFAGGFGWVTIQKLYWDWIEPGALSLSLAVGLCTALMAIARFAGRRAKMPAGGSAYG